MSNPSDASSAIARSIDSNSDVPFADLSREQKLVYESLAPVAGLASMTKKVARPVLTTAVRLIQMANAYAAAFRGALRACTQNHA
jgi:hypothetical protein